MADGPSPVLDYGAFHHPPNALFRDYLAGSASARGFYDGGRWDIEALALSSKRAASHPRDRAALAAALTRQQEERRAPQAAAMARALGEPDTVAVITGQQAGLFGGPLFVLYKALAAVKVAAALQAKRGAPVVPVFWVASDDHDFAEIRSVNVLDETGRQRTIRYEPHREPVGQPASRVVLDDTAVALVDELRRCLPESPSRAAMLERLGECYAPGATIAGAFAAFLSSVLPALVFLDPSDPELKAIMAPVLSREIREGSPTSRLAAEVGDQLLAAGYHQQVPVRPGFLNLFVLMDGERRSLGLQNGDIEVRGLGRRIPIPDALALLQKDPAPWSPGVLLRPLAQDHLLPTAAYVGGPAEIAYHAQIGPSYPHFGIPRSPLLPRPGATLVEPAQARVLEAEGLTLADLQGDPETLVARWAREAYPEVEGAFTRARESVDRDLADVENKLAALDPTLRAAADAARGRALHQIEALHEKATRALKKRDQVRADRIRRTRDALFPGGAFQERGLGLIGLLCRHGAAVVDTIGNRLEPWATGHQVIHL